MSKIEFAQDGRVGEDSANVYYRQCFVDSAELRIDDFVMVNDNSTDKKTPARVEAMWRTKFTQQPVIQLRKVSQCVRIID